MKKWSIGSLTDLPAVTAAAKELSSKGNISMLAAYTLASRGIDTMEKAMGFFGDNPHEGYDDEGNPVPEFVMGFPSPYLINDMEKACDLLNDAIDSASLICVYGDYDCDGITATAVMYSYLSNIGGCVEYYINDRSEGYGMNCDAVRRLFDRGVKVILTVDNGIAAFEEAKLCRQLGITLIITDHHQPSQSLPLAAAVVDAHRTDCNAPYRDYCGCGLALRLIAAMEGGRHGDMHFATEQYSDLAAIATVADVVPLTGENRKIVQHGLHYIENSENPGLNALLEAAGVKHPLTAESLAFGLAPRINAAGRVARATDALELLLCEDPDEAAAKAEKICGYNNRRKILENTVMESIAAEAEINPSVLDNRVLVFSGKGWHHGVVGIAAARCQERFDRPVFLISVDDEEARGSARSTEEFNVFDALSFCDDLLERFGGHSGAGGFSLKPENIPAFSQRLQEYAAQLIKQRISFTPALDVVKAVSAEELTIEQVKGLDILEPFGEGNSKPLFLAAGAMVSDIFPLKGGEHTKIIVTISGKSFTALMFSRKTATLPFEKGDSVNMLFSAEINRFNGCESVTLRVADIMKAGIKRNSCIAAEDVYHAFRRGESIDERLMSRMLPDRNELAAVYRAIGKIPMSAESIFGRIKYPQDINYCKALLCIDIFEEAGLIKYDRFAETAVTIPTKEKADLTRTPTYMKLANKGQQSSSNH